MTSPVPFRSFTAESLTVRVYDGQEALAHDAALQAADCLRASLQAHSRASVILASATSQIQFLSELVRMPDIDWSGVTLFHMDEYLGLTADHPASFRRFLRDHVLVHTQPRAVHLIEGEALEPLRECARYAALLQQQPIDLCCLGIGENGHLAFNDPAVADFDDPRPVKLVKLDEACRRQQVGEGCFSSVEAVPQYAFTLTIPTLLAARQWIGVVPERRKAAAVREALQGPLGPHCPASILRQQSHGTLFLDVESASALAPGN